MVHNNRKIDISVTRNMPFHKVKFTDIDVTLVDINTAEYGKETSKLIRLIKDI